MKIKLTLGILMTCLSALAQENVATIPECVTTYKNEITYQKGATGSLKNLLGTDGIGVYINFRKAKVEYVSFETFLRTKRYDWQMFDDEYAPEYEAKFIKNANDALSDDGITLLPQQVTDYMLRVTVIYFNDDNDMQAAYEIINTKTCEVECRIDFEAESGTFGSKFNLMGDTFEEAGEKFGKKLRKLPKK